MSKETKSALTEEEKAKAEKFKKIDTEFMYNYIKDNSDSVQEDLREFKKIAYKKIERDSEGNAILDDKGQFKYVANLDSQGNPKYNLLLTKRWFCQKYMPDLLPKAKEQKKRNIAKEIFDSIQ